METLRKIGKACGVTGALTDPSVQLLGKSLSAELVEGEKGYMEIKEDFGNTFQPVVKKETTEKVARENLKKKRLAKMSRSSEPLKYDRPSLCSYCMSPSGGLLLRYEDRYYGSCCMEHTKKIKERLEKRENLYRMSHN